MEKRGETCAAESIFKIGLISFVYYNINFGIFPFYTLCKIDVVQNGWGRSDEFSILGKMLLNIQLFCDRGCLLMLK